MLQSITGLRTVCLVAATPLALAALVGCLERKETITVRPNGAVRIEMRIQGEPQDVFTGDQMPDLRTGWRVDDETVTKDDGKQEFRRVATLDLPAGSALPTSFAPQDDANHETALQFPTDVRVERRADGTFYHFKRVYQPREQARFEYLKSALQEAGVFKAAEGKDLAELSTDELSDLVRALRTIEASKHAQFVQLAVDTVGEKWPGHFELLLRAAVTRHFEGAEVAPVVALLQQPGGEARDRQIDEFGRRLTTDARDVLRRTLMDLGAPRRQIEQFFAAYDLEQARRAVTEDIGDETFEVRVALPGKLIAHDGDLVEDGAVVWKFPGKALYDRPQTLTALSRVGPNAERAAER
ncbi:MAG: hypothetical protein AB7Q17_10055 [Phycisphaerae bacterium]